MIVMRRDKRKKRRREGGDDNDDVLRSRFVRIVRSATAIVIACNDACLGIIINR
jgi:hypothetical protein